MTSITTTTTTSMEIENDTIVEMMKLLKESTWNIKEVLELFTTSSDISNLFTSLETAYKHDFDETKRLRLLSVFSLAPKEIHEKYKNEILSIVKLSKELSVDNTWNKFLSTLLETILNDDTNGIDNGLLQQEIQTILTTTTNNDSNTEEDKQLMMKFNISFLPKQFMYMETNELPTFILDSISNKDKEEKHFIPRPKPSMNASTNNNEDNTRRFIIY